MSQALKGKEHDKIVDLAQKNEDYLEKKANKRVGKSQSSCVPREKGFGRNS